jgi:hypothetical protein
VPGAGKTTVAFAVHLLTRQQNTHLFVVGFEHINFVVIQIFFRIEKESCELLICGLSEGFTFVL